MKWEVKLGPFEQWVQWEVRHGKRNLAVSSPEYYAHEYIFQQIIDCKVWPHYMHGVRSMSNKRIVSNQRIEQPHRVKLALTFFVMRPNCVLQRLKWKSSLLRKKSITWQFTSHLLTMEYFFVSTHPSTVCRMTSKSLLLSTLTYTPRGRWRFDNKRVLSGSISNLSRIWMVPSLASLGAHFAV